MKSIPFTLARKDAALLLLRSGRRECDIARALGIDRKTIWRAKKRYRTGGLTAALEEKPRSGQPKKYTIRHETELVAHACSTPPEGRKRWTLELLSERMRGCVKGCRTMNRESIRLMLKKTNVSLG